MKMVQHTLMKVEPYLIHTKQYIVQMVVIVHQQKEVDHAYNMVNDKNLT